MVPRIVAAFRGVHGIGVRVGYGSHAADPVTVFRSGLGHAGAGQPDRGEVILVGADEQRHTARVAFGAAGVADAERVGGSRRRGDGLGDGTPRMHVCGRVPVPLPVQFEVLVAAGGVHVLPGERGGGQAAGLHARLSGHGLRVGADRARIGLHIHPGQALPLLRDAPLRGVEPAVHGQLVARGPGGDGLHLGVRSLERGRLRGIRLRIGGHLALVVLLQIMHRQAGSGFVSRESDTARGLGLGGLYGVLLATLIRRDLAGRVGCVLVIGQLVGTGEFDVVHEIADVVAGPGLIIFEPFEALEHEYRVLLSFGHLVIAFVRLPLAAMVSGIGVGYLCGDGGGLPAHLVAMAVRGDAGHLHRRRVGCVGAHEDLHLVGMGGLAAGVLEPDLVQYSAVAGGHVLVEAGVVLLGDDLRIRVLGVAILLQFDP